MSRQSSGRGAKVAKSAKPAKPAKGAKAAKGTSASRSTATARTGRPGGVFVQTPKSDIYVVLLGISVGAIVLGCVLLALLLNQYGFKSTVA